MNLVDREGLLALLAFGICAVAAYVSSKLDEYFKGNTGWDGLVNVFLFLAMLVGVVVVWKFALLVMIVCALFTAWAILRSIIDYGLAKIS